MTKAKPTKGVSAMANTKISMDRFWLSIGIPIIIWVFTAGIGWNRLGYVESATAELRQEMKLVYNGRDESKDRLIVVEQKLSELLRAVEKQGTQLDTIGKAAMSARK